MTQPGSTELPPWLDVSPETHLRLVSLWDLVQKWNPAINLVSGASLSDGWRRHILDSAQLFEIAGVTKGLWADLGSGGGFPGLIIAALAFEKSPGLEVALVESDKRKATFLAQAARTLGLSVQVHCARVETLGPLDADVVSARALAPLSKLCGMISRHLKHGGVGIVPKGPSHETELQEARKLWQFQQEVFASRTQPDSAVLQLWNIRNA